VHVTVGERACGGKPVTDVVILIPFPSCVRSTSLTANVGSVSHDPKTNETRWEIAKLPNDKTPELIGTALELHWQRL
jgi:hypothetical protein